MIEKVLGFICVVLGVIIIWTEYGYSISLSVWCLVFGLYGMLKR